MKSQDKLFYYLEMTRQIKVIFLQQRLWRDMAIVHHPSNSSAVIVYAASRG